jgi:hypothetical protein
MIKAVLSRDDGSKVLLLGLSKMNSERLHQSMPIQFDGNDVGGLNGITHIAIIGGEDEQDLANQLAQAGMKLPKDVEIPEAVKAPPKEKRNALNILEALRTVLTTADGARLARILGTMIENDPTSLRSGTVEVMLQLCMMLHHLDCEGPVRLQLFQEANAHVEAMARADNDISEKN